MDSFNSQMISLHLCMQEDFEKQKKAKEELDKLSQDIDDLKRWRTKLTSMVNMHTISQQQVAQGNMSVQTCRTNMLRWGDQFEEVSCTCHCMCCMFDLLSDQDCSFSFLCRNTSAMFSVVNCRSNVILKVPLASTTVISCLQPVCKQTVCAVAKHC